MFPFCFLELDAMEQLWSHWLQGVGEEFITHYQILLGVK
jgi:hypothetical protein